MDKTHTGPFAAGFNARCEARTAAANAIVVGEYPIVSGPAPDDSALTWPVPAAQVQRIWNGPCKAPAPAPVTNIDATLLARLTYYVMIWHAEGVADDYEEYFEMRSIREEMESMLPEVLTTDEINDLFTICEVAF